MTKHLPDLPALYAAGMSCNAIAAKFGCDSETIRLRLVAAGVTRRPKNYIKARPTPTWDDYFAGKFDESGSCLIWRGFKDPTGYGRLAAAFARKIHFAHRLSFWLAKGPFDHSARVLHRCDTPSCINPKHLWLGTQAENVADMYAKGRNNNNTPRGEANGLARLTERQVKAIRRLKARGLPQIEMSRRFGVSPMTISRAVRGQSWSHVK